MLRNFDMSASVKYWYVSRMSSGVSMKLMFGSFPMAWNVAVAKSRKVRAFPVPRLYNPLEDDWRWCMRK